jgi:hypothetical protein
MFKSVFGTASMLGIAGLLAFSGCSSDSTGSDVNGNGGEHNGATGGIGLALQLADGSNVGTVTYSVLKDGIVVRTGPLEIGADGRASGTISGLDAGPGYSVHLVAPRTRDGGTATDCTGDSAPFTVIENQNVPVSVVLQCDDSSTGGNITINGQFNICPKVTSGGATPSTQAVGSAISLTSSASDRDGDALTYAWFTGATYSAGTVFASTQNASFTCTTAGTFTLNVAAYDGDLRGCRKALSQPITVTCTDATTVDSGTPVVDSGTPVVDSGTPVVDSGTPVVDSGTPVVDSGTPVVDSGTPVVDSGTPVVDSGTPVVDSGTGTGGPTKAYLGTASCETCTQTNCNPQFGFLFLIDDCADATCGAVFSCFQRNHCAVDSVTVHQCYCGAGVTLEACRAAGYVATGPCANLVQTGLGTTVSSEVIDRFVGTDTDTGDGIALFSCVAESCIPECVTSTTIPAP